MPVPPRESIKPFLEAKSQELNDRVTELKEWTLVSYFDQLSQQDQDSINLQLSKTEEALAETDEMLSRYV